MEIISSSQKIESEYFSRLLRMLCILAIAYLGFAKMDEKSVNAQTATTETSPEIFYGRPATPEEAAFAVYITSGAKKCSGIILSEQVIATAFHCVSDNRRNIVDLSEKDVYIITLGDASKPAYKVKEIRELGKGTPFNDRALLSLERPISFSELVQPIKIGTNEMKYKDGLYAIGSGRNEDLSLDKYPRVGKQFLKRSSTKCTSPGIIVTQNRDESSLAVINHGDSGGGLFVNIPEDDPDFEPGNYILATTTSFCSDDLYDENGNINPYYEAGFQVLYFDSIQEQIEQAITDPALWPAPPTYYFPSIKNGKNETYIPQLKK